MFRLCGFLVFGFFGIGVLFEGVEFVCLGLVLIRFVIDFDLFNVSVILIGGGSDGGGGGGGGGGGSDGGVFLDVGVRRLVL